MFRLTSTGDFKNTEAFLKRGTSSDVIPDLNEYGRMGVEALRSATPVDSGATANGWRYEIERYRTVARVCWYNDHIENGTLVAVLIQYGHGTRNGGYVQGRDYINPAMRPIFTKAAEEIWKKVNK